MKFGDRPLGVWALPGAALLLAAAVLGTDAGGISERLSGILFDAYQHASPRTYEDPAARTGTSVRVLAVDDATLRRLGPWPWPRALLARLVGELKEAGAAEVVLALPLDKPDPLSPQNLASEVPAGADFNAARTALASLPSPDAALATAMQTTKSVAGFVLGDTAYASAPSLKASLVYSGSKDPLGRLPYYEAASGALQPIEKASAGLGALNLLVDSDGKVRRMPVAFRVGGESVPALDAEAMRVSEAHASIAVRSDDGEAGFLRGSAGVASLSAPLGDIPTGPNGAFWISFSGPKPERDISAADLDAHAVPPRLLKNAIVYLGAPDQTVATPDGMRSAAEVHAEALENILLGTVLRRPASAGLAEIVILALLGIAIVAVFARFGVALAGAATIVAIAALSYVSWHLYSVDHVLFDALGPGLGLAFVFAAGASARAFEVARSRLALRSAFADALPLSVIDRLAREPQLLKLGGESRTVTYLSCGIRGFAALAASFREDPTTFTRLVQRVLTPLMDEALSHGGTIDRLTSDGFTAFWNAPLDDTEHAMHACEAASRMTEIMARVNETVSHERRIDGVALAPVEIGIGISTGSAIAGGFRAHGRTAYSVTGDCTIVATRIQSTSSQYGPAVIVSESTRNSSERGFAFLEVDYIACGAHDEAIKLYAMLGNPLVRASPKFRALMTFHDHIFQSLRSQQWEKTRQLIDQCRKLSGASQKLYDLHLARVSYFESNPPGTDWDGAFRPILK